MIDQLWKPTSILGLPLWVVLCVCVGAAIVVLIIFLVSLSPCLASKRSKKIMNHPSIPVISKEIRVDHARNGSHTRPDPEIDPDPVPETEQEEKVLLGQNNHKKIRFGIAESTTHHVISSYPNNNDPTTTAFARSSSSSSSPVILPSVSHLGWGHWYSLRELEDFTDGFSDENVIGEGGYGIVYRGVLKDNKTHVAIKNLLNNNRGQAEKEFKVEVEAIGRVRHKNLVRLMGYCAEGAHRMLVYEYVDNGNLEQWLHGDVGPFSPLTWEIRMNIILGTAKGLSYLHEGLEPKVVHRDIKSSNILIDKHWNPKVSDFGLSKLLASERSYITTRVMGTFGYVAPEYACTGMLNERSDVYSFGILIMEVITGRNPVDYSRPPHEVSLVDWVKKMVSDRNTEGVLDPRLPEKPSSRSLKRALLVALRCTDPNAQDRPKMGHVVHMLEAEDSPYKEDRRVRRDAGQH